MPVDIDFCRNAEWCDGNALWSAAGEAFSSTDMFSRWSHNILRHLVGHKSENSLLVSPLIKKIGADWPLIWFQMAVLRKCRFTKGLNLFCTGFNLFNTNCRWTLYSNMPRRHWVRRNPAWYVSDQSMGSVVTGIQAGVFGGSNPGGVSDHPNRFLGPSHLLFNACFVSFRQGTT